MVEIDKLDQQEFKELPLVVEGESKEVRYGGNGEVIIRFKPTIYSFTANRSGIIEGSDVLRLRASKIFLEVLQNAGISHSYQEVNDNWVRSELVLQPQTEHNPNPFRPSDLEPEQIKQLPVAPPIETIVKRMHSGTSKHRYFQMDGHPVRNSHPLYGGMAFDSDDAYPVPIVRFDWRNPLIDPSGKKLADEILPDTVADWYIDTKVARKTALGTFDAMTDFLAAKDVVCYDLCLFVTEDGKKVFGEISQDCGRFRHFDLGSLDKDVWRAGGSSEMVLKKWATLLDIMQSK